MDEQRRAMRELRLEILNRGKENCGEKYSGGQRRGGSGQKKRGREENEEIR